MGRRGSFIIGSRYFLALLIVVAPVPCHPVSDMVGRREPMDVSSGIREFLAMPTSGLLSWQGVPLRPYQMDGKTFVFASGIWPYFR